MTMNRFVQSNNQNWKTRDPEREMQPTNTKRKSRLHPWSYKKRRMLQSAVLFRILNNRQRNDRVRVVLERHQVGLKEEQPASTRHVKHSACENFIVFRARWACLSSLSPIWSLGLVRQTIQPCISSDIDLACWHIWRSLACNYMTNVKAWYVYVHGVCVFYYSYMCTHENFFFVIYHLKQRKKNTHIDIELSQIQFPKLLSQKHHLTWLRIGLVQSPHWSSRPCMAQTGKSLVGAKTNDWRKWNWQSHVLIDKKQTLILKKCFDW